MNTVKSVEIKVAHDPFDLSLMEFGGSAVAILTMSDGSVEHFGWFHDELTFTRSDFIGKTMEEIRALHRQRDMAYLRS